MHKKSLKHCSIIIYFYYQQYVIRHESEIQELLYFIVQILSVVINQFFYTYFSNIQMQANLDGKRLRNIVENALKGIVKKYQKYAPKFQMYLSNFEQTQYLSPLIHAIYENIADLNITKADISDLLTEIGKQEYIKRGFEMTYYQLWFEFVIIVEGTFRQRIKEQDIWDFPYDRKQQLVSLKAMCLACAQNNEVNLQEKILQSLEEHTLFKQFLSCKEKFLKKNVQKSQIKAEEQIRKSTIQNLKADQIEVIFMQVLENIGRKVGIIRRVQDFTLTRERLKDYVNDVILSPESLQNEIITVNLKEVLLSILGIQLRKNNCTLIDQTQEAIKESFNIFQDFYQLSDATIKCKNSKMSVEDYFQFLGKQLYKEKNYIWYWPIYNGKSLISFLLSNALQNQKRVDFLVQNLNMHPPNLDAYINNPSRKTFLQEVLTELPSQGPINQILKCMTRLIERQRVDIQRQLSTNLRTYYSLLRGKGIPTQKLDQISLIQQEDNNKFYIFCNRTKTKQPLPLTPEHVTQLIAKTRDSKFYDSEVFDAKGYQLIVTMTNQICPAQFISGTSGAYKKEVRFEGTINYGDIYEFKGAVKNFTWRVMGIEMWKEYDFTQNESQLISEKIFNSRKGSESSFPIKLSQHNMQVEINCINWEVKELAHDEKVTQSLFKKKFGFLVYIPSHKMKSTIRQQEDLPLQDNNPYPSIEEDVSGRLPPQVQSFAHVFQFLGVFRSFFEIDSGFVIDSQKNIATQNQNIIQYFKNWEEITFYRLIDESLNDKQFKPIKNQKANNIFQVHRKMYGSIIRQFRLLESKLKKNIEVSSFDQKRSEMQVTNLKQDEKSHDFFLALIEYLSLKITKNDQNQSYRLQLSSYELRVIDSILPKDAKIIGKNNTGVTIQSSKQDKDKLLESLHALDEIQEFTYEHPEAYQLMKKIHDDQLIDMSVVEVQVGSEIFKVQIRLKYHAKFKQLLKQCYDMIQEKPGEIKQVKIPGQAQFLHIYRSQFLKVDTQIMISKLGNDILLEFNSKIEKRVNDALARIKDAKDREFFKYLKKSSKEHTFKNVSHTLLYELRDKVLRILQKSAKVGLKPKLDINLLNGSEYTLKAEQISPEQQQQFDKMMEGFKNRFEELQNYKKKINDTNIFITKSTNKLPKNKKSSLIMTKLTQDFSKFLTGQIVKIIELVTKDRLNRLQQEFNNFIKNQNLEDTFISKQAQQSVIQIQKKIDDLNIFSRPYIDTFVQQLCEILKAKPINSAIDKMIKEMQPIIDSTTQKFKSNSLKPQQFQKYFKSLNILGRIYLGEQLPITQHLQTFKDKLSKNDVVMVKVGTGSGKSTVIPPYLIGLGYEKVVVTQPRRLPCRQIYKRINSVFGKGISGYEVGDGSADEQNRLLYMTDGLLKMKAIFKMEKVFDQIDVLMIDQIHERSANIDMLLLILYVYFKYAKRKLKLVLCSATIDTKIGKMLEEAGLKVDTFFVETNRHKVTESPIEGTIIDKVVQISKKLQPDEQMLIFYPGIKEVNDTVSILMKKYNRLAYPITANQNPKDQQRNLQMGSIFVATAIAQTSLTFRKLKYVVDSRMSRSRAFNSELEIMVTEEDYSSKSSIQQRKGRLGRTCPGQYFYMVYNDINDQNIKEHNPTELEKIDLTAYVFQLLLIQGSNFNNVSLLLAKLKHEETEFNKKIDYSRGILQDLCILKTNGTLQNSAAKLTNYGNLGNPQHNYALFEASMANCQVNIMYLTSFFMVASNLSSEILKYAKTLYKGGDIKIIHDFVAKIVEEINLKILKKEQIPNAIKQNCPYIANKSWFMTIVRVITKVKQLFSSCVGSVPSTDWKSIIKVLTHAYRNKLFFNQQIFGANKNLFEKLRNNTTFNFEQRQDYKVIYKMDMNSALYKQNNLPKLILSLNSSISPDSECVLSICEEIDPSIVNEQIKIAIIGTQCDQKYFNGTMPIKEEQVLDHLQSEVRSNYNRIKVISAFPKMTFTGNFKEISDAFVNFIEPKRRNLEIKFKLNTILEEAIQKRLVRAAKDPMMPKIDPRITRSMLEKLTNYDFKTMFQTTKFEMANNFGVDIQWDAKTFEATLIAKKIKNIHIDKLLVKLISFFRWFADSQVICKEEFKIKPRYIQQGPLLTNDVREKIMARVNNIVDSKIEPYIVKGWANGKGAATKYPRTARMIAVCWVLTNIFNCSIKGGFVRDWVVNGQEVLPAGNLKNLLQKNPKNEYLQVIDDTVTPSDIDAELSPYVLFDEQKFKKQMSKLGISVIVEEDGWRKHIIFDLNAQTGGFTADLIQTYTSMCHDTYDFDVNTLYLKKNNVNAIGRKIPLEFQGKKKIQLEELLASCKKKEMKKLKENIWQHRLKKFIARGWKIKQNQFYTPAVYKSYTTQSFPISPNNIKEVSPVFFNEMVTKRNIKVVKIERLCNKAWDDAFEGIEHWIITEMERTAMANDPANYANKNFNSNSKMLFHGSSPVGIQGIKQFGFDSRFFNATGFYGRGAYFADDPELSNRFSGQNSDGLRQMFVVKVALGEQEVLNVAANNKLGPSRGFHSILGQAGGHREYIIERWGQAKPMYLITYR